MDKSEVDRIKGQITEKIRKGDYVTLGEMIKENQETARTRFRRGNKEAVLAMQTIVTNRDTMINDYQTQ